MAIEVVPAKVEDMNIKQLVKECTERDPDRWRNEGRCVSVSFDDTCAESFWFDFDTPIETAFRNHIYAGVCSSVEEIAFANDSAFTLKHLVTVEKGNRTETFFIQYYRYQSPLVCREFGDNRAEAALRAFVSFLRATT